MEEFISSIIQSSSFSGGRTLAPGPLVAPSRGHGPVVLATQDSAGPSGTHHQFNTHEEINPNVLMPRNTNVIPSPSPSESILRTDMSPMIAWLTSQHGIPPDSFPLNPPSAVNNASSEAYTNADYQKRIPKPYIELNERDCAGVVAQAIRSIVLHTCNDQFRQQCLSKLGASNSRDVEREVNARLIALIEQEEQQSVSDTENQEIDQNTTSPQPPPPPTPVFLNLNIQQ